MIYRYFLSFLLVFSIFAINLPQIGYAQNSAAQSTSGFSSELKAIEEKLEKRRQELGIPGLSLVIVKDGQVIYMKGLGYKDFENKISVTPDTQFAIGSATKAFTALSVLISQDQGKLSLDDSPKKYLPYFKMHDPDTDKNITVRDLMAHTSGLNRTDLAMITGRLNREELIRVAGEAKPMAKLREKFFYQNIMFAAAGEIVAKTQKTTWEKFVPQNIFKPLGMSNSTMSMKQMEKAKDYSFGYEHNFDTKETRKLPFRDIDPVAPAGSINSSARDMANWLKFVMNGGQANGKRLISEKGYEEWTKPQMKIGGKMSYGLGWFLRDWNGMKVIEHGGNIDGFNSLVAMIPEKKLGFVMLTNVSGSSLGEELMKIVWENILGNPNAKPAGPATPSADALQKEAGLYHLAEAGIDIEIKLKDGKLVAVVPGQPEYTLVNTGGRKYKLDGAPDGFFVTFKDDSAYLEQPQGNLNLSKKVASAAGNKGSEAAKELIGKYESEAAKGRFVDIKDDGGKITLNIDGQPPYALVDKEKDAFSLSPLPAEYWLKVKRGADGKIEKIISMQPNGEFAFIRRDEKAEDKPKITVDEVMAKAIQAAGGEANLRKITSRILKADIDLIHQGMKGSMVSYAKSPNKAANEMIFTALGKEVAFGYDFFDGANGQAAYTFAPEENYAGKKLADAKLGADMLAMLNWKANYKSVNLKGMEKAEGEDCYAIEFIPEKGTKATEYYSAKSFLLVKRNGFEASSTSGLEIPVSTSYSDYRDVDGVKLPFKMVNSNPGMGEIIITVKEIKHNTEIADNIFSPKKLFKK